MADVLCPVCGKPNSQEEGVCQFCGASLKPGEAIPPADLHTLKPGDEPTRRDTSEFEKDKPPIEGSIHPGDIPTRKNTAELEQALPSWLRSLRESKRPAAGESMAAPSLNEEKPSSAAFTGSEAPGDLPDWLAGLDKAGSEEDEIPDWLAGLQENKPAEAAASSGEEENPTPGLENEDWMRRLDNQEPPAASQSPINATPPAPVEPGLDLTPEPDAQGDLGDWLKSLQSSESGEKQPSSASQPAADADLPDWLSGLAGIAEDGRPAVDESKTNNEPFPAESNPDWLNELKQNSAASELPPDAEESGSVPDWLSGLGSTPAAPAAGSEGNLPDWLSNLGEKSGPQAEMPPAQFESEPMAADNPPGETPDWLSRLQADYDTVGESEQQKADFEAASETPAPLKGTGPLPEWLTGIQPTTPTSGGSTPALIPDNKVNLPSQEGAMAFSMETPDWLSKLNPEQGSEKQGENQEGPQAAEDLEAAELPSWVQAMRPVEAVVDSKTAALDEQATEHSGPLAGLRGILPAEPGLGALRKPPVYSSKLLVSDGQQRYAAALERLVAGESNPRTTEPKKLVSNRLWRWVITLLLLLAISLPFLSTAQIAPTFLTSSDKGASSKIIQGLQSNVPVLVAFDYDPALSGEMEAVSAPIMDQLLSMKTPLALISTNPTGPALAEHFLQTTSLVNVYKYQSGQQYVNLGYLAGGPAGILYLAGSLNSAMPVDVNGKPAWNSGPLQGIQSLSNFAAVIVLTDNADTGRNWIEQAGPRLGNTPLLMVISAQAEPMIRPYFDSGQLKGLVSGLADAKIYEQNYNRPGLAYHYWNSFSVGMLMTELMIVAGVILGLYFDRRALRKNSREGA